MPEFGASVGLLSGPGRSLMGAQGRICFVSYFQKRRLEVYCRLGKGLSFPTANAAMVDLLKRTSLVKEW